MNAQISQEQIRLLYRLTYRALPINALVALLFVAVLWNKTYSTHLILWLCVFVLVLFEQTLHIKRVIHENFYTRLFRLQIHLKIRSFINGCVWGGGFVLFYPPAMYESQLILTFFLSGLAAGALNFLAVTRSTYLIFILPMILPITFYYFFDSAQGLEIVGVICITYIILLTVVSDNISKIHSENIQNHLENLSIADAIQLDNIH